MIGSGLAAEQTVFSQVLNLWALTGQRLKSGLRLNVAFLKDNQCFIRCDRPWSPLLTCEDKRQSESFLWFWKNHPLTKSHRNNSLCWSGWLCFDGQLTGAWAASRTVLSYERRPDSWLCTKKTLHTNKLWDQGGSSLCGRTKHPQSFHLLATLANTRVTVLNTQLFPPQRTLQPQQFWEHAC